MFESDFQTKTPERLKPHGHQELRELADQEVGLFFPTSEVGEIHKFFYRDAYRFTAMVERVMEVVMCREYFHNVFSLFFNDGILANLRYPEE